MEWGDEWWKHLSGPQKFIDEAAELMRSHGMVFLRVPDDLCWRHPFRAALMDRVREWSDESPIFEELDIQDECPDVTNEKEAGYAVLHKLLGSDDTGGYRPSYGPVSKFINEQAEKIGLFEKRVLWIKGLHSGEARKAFYDLCSRFQKKKVRIFFEDSLNAGQGRIPHNMVDYSHFVTHFDVQLLCMSATNNDDRGVYRVLSLPWRQYIAVLSANLCGEDAELAVALLTEHNLREEDPLLALQSLADGEQFAARGRPGHILYALREDTDGGRAAVQNQVWKSQLQLCLPILEEAWTETLQILRDDLSRILYRETIEQYKEPIANPEDFEVGTVVYLMAAGKLFVPDAALKKRIHIIHENRNRLAHCQVCTTEQIENVFNHCAQQFVETSHT